MDNESTKSIISEWCADVCPIPSGAAPAWSKLLATIPQEHFNLCMSAIDAISENCQRGQYKRNPNRSTFYHEYNRLKLIHESNGRGQHQGCNECAQSGLLYCVMALDISIGSQRPVRKNVAIPSPRADILLIPCSCEKGTTVHYNQVVNPNCKPDDPNRHLSKDKLIQLATSCGYSSRGEAEEYRAKCEHFFRAWTKKYPNKKLDQTQGYKGTENTKVPGFQPTRKPEYEPEY